MFATTKARLATALVALAALITAITAPGWHREHANHAGARHVAHAKVDRATTHQACGHVHTNIHADASANMASAAINAPTSQDRDVPTLPPPHSDDDGCAICLAINLPTGDGLPLPLISRAISFLWERLITLPAETPIVAFLPVLWSCGPPSCATAIKCA